MSQDQSAEQTLEKIREQNRIRSKRYYEANQAKIATKRKEAREDCKECKIELTKCEDCKPEKNQKRKITQKQFYQFKN